jgi:hypothetical protein
MQILISTMPRGDFAVFYGELMNAIVNAKVMGDTLASGQLTALKVRIDGFGHLNCSSFMLGKDESDWIVRYRKKD